MCWDLSLERIENNNNSLRIVNVVLTKMSLGSSMNEGRYDLCPHLLGINPPAHASVDGSLKEKTCPRHTSNMDSFPGKQFPSSDIRRAPDITDDCFRQKPISDHSPVYARRSGTGIHPSVMHLHISPVHNWQFDCAI